MSREKPRELPIPVHVWTWAQYERFLGGDIPQAWMTPQERERVVKDQQHAATAA